MKRRLLAVGVVVISGCVSLILSSTEEPIIQLSMGTPMFGNVNVSMQKMNVLTYTPQTGSDDDTITDVAFGLGNCSQFSLMGPPPLPNHMGSTRVYTSMTGACDASMGMFQAGSASGGMTTCPYVFTATFAPTAPGAVTCNVDITYHTTSNPSDGHVETLVLTGTGVVPAGLSVTPSSVNFGNIPLNGSSTVTPVTVRNTASQTETVSGNNSDPGAVFFQVIGGNFAGHPLAPNATDVYNTWCHPTMLGSGSASLMFNAVNGGFGSGAQSNLACTGINSNLQITPIPVLFATTLVGRPSGPQDVMIKNNGVSLGALTVAPDQEAMGNGVTLANNVNGPLAAGAMVTATLNYAAGAQHMGSLGNLVVNITTDAMPFNVGLNGEADVGAIATNPIPIAFNTICAGAASMQSLDIYASAQGDVNLISATVSPSSVFSVSGVTGTVKGNHANDIIATVTANPSAVGDIPGTVTIVTNIPNTPNQDVAITGTAMAGGIAANPDLAHFGAVATGMISSEQAIMLTNCGAGDLTVTGTSFMGITPLEFTVVNPPQFPLAIPKTQSQTFKVAMTPLSIGPKSAMLVIASDQAPTTVLFDGTGIGGSDGGNKDRETYYACSVGGGGAAWPIGFALLALRRRRRR